MKDNGILLFLSLNYFEVLNSYQFLLTDCASQQRHKTCI